MTRPALRYYGGKWRAASWIISHFPPHRAYVEPFGGGASVLLQKPRSHSEIYNDMDGEVVNFFRVLRDPARAERLAELLELTPYSRADFDESYTPVADPIEQARRTVARAFMGYSSNGVSRRKTGFRADSGKSGTDSARSWRHYPQHVQGLVRRLQGVVIENRPALDVIRQHDGPGTLHYIDPPYLATTRNEHDAQIYRHEMSAADHEDLLRAVREIEGAAIVSGYESELYSDWLHDWPVARKAARAGRNAPRTETIWISPNTQHKTLFSEAHA